MRMPHSDERTAVFIDGKSLNLASKAIGLQIDYNLMRDYFMATTKLVRIAYYTVVPEEGDYNSIKPLTEWLGYNGYVVVTKTIRLTTDGNGSSRLPGNVDVEMAVDMVEMCPRLDHIVLCSNNGSMKRAVDAVQRLATRVTVIAASNSDVSKLSSELRRQADEFVDLKDLAPEIQSKSRNNGQPPTD